MSCFDGKLFEYPFITIDRFDMSNLDSTIYLLSHFHKDHIEGLDSKDFLMRLKSGGSDVHLYTSDTTLHLMQCDPVMSEVVQFAKGLPIDQTFTIFGTDHDGKPESVVLTLLSAAHCVGSVMFLIEGRNGVVLYTGDFRLGKAELKKMKWLHIGNRVRHIKSVYLDTTFCTPAVPDLPSRAETKALLCEVIANWINRGRNRVVHLRCKGKFGYEYIMKEVAKHFRCQIHVNDSKLDMYSKLPDLRRYFTSDGAGTPIHCCYNPRSMNWRCLPCGLEAFNGGKPNVLTVVPSSLWFVQRGIPGEWKYYDRKSKFWRVCHSMHASYNEIREFVGYLQPENIFPCVPDAQSGDPLVAYDRLKDLQKPVALEVSCANTTTCSDVAANNALQEDSGQCQWNRNLAKVVLSPKSASRHRKALGFSQLNLVRSPPPLKKRRRKRTVSTVSEAGVVLVAADCDVSSIAAAAQKSSCDGDRSINLGNSSSSLTNATKADLRRECARPLCDEQIGSSSKLFDAMVAGGSSVGLLRPLSDGVNGELESVVVLPGELSCDTGVRQDRRISQRETIVISSDSDDQHDARGCESDETASLTRSQDLRECPGGSASSQVAVPHGLCREVGLTKTAACRPGSEESFCWLEEKPSKASEGHGFTRENAIEILSSPRQSRNSSCIVAVLATDFPDDTNSGRTASLEN